jgi:hypothetical protein
MGLLGEVYKYKALELKTKMMEAIVPDSAILPQLLNMLNFTREFYSNDPLLCQLLDQREMEEIQAAPQFNDIVNEAVALIENLLTEGIKRGEIRTIPTKMAAYFCFRIGFFITQYGRDLFTRFPPEALFELVNSVLMEGIITHKKSEK